MSYHLTAVIEKDIDGYYAYCPTLMGCQSQGETLEEVQVNIREAIALYLETLTSDERKRLFDREVTTMMMEVQVA
ncbi:MAG: type II toxin-antitoxin system HicB family antitoxin [Cyanobacteria bacterium]|nr:type II toxin-antitoxin system HicB family antitoxin [Cyanobacteriota bacterium]